MHDVEIDRYPTISTSACVRSGLTRRPRPPEPAASHAESARAAPLRSRTDRDPMPRVTFIRSATSRSPIGDVAVGIGSPLVSRREPKRSFLTPKGAFGRGGAMFTEGRIRDPMPSDTPAPFPHAVRGRPDHRSASAVPVLTGGAGGQNRVLEVHCGLRFWLERGLCCRARGL